MPKNCTRSGYECKYTVHINGIGDGRPDQAVRQTNGSHLVVV